MAQRVFFSFHFDNDFWRTQQIRNMDAVEAQGFHKANDWEEVKRRGSGAIDEVDSRQHVQP